MCFIEILAKEVEGKYLPAHYGVMKKTILIVKLQASTPFLLNIVCLILFLPRIYLIFSVHYPVIATVHWSIMACG